MDVRHFNAALLLGWLLVTVGGVWLHPAAGLVASGASLVGLTLVAVRLGGGLFQQPAQRAIQREDIG